MVEKVRKFFKFYIYPIATLSGSIIGVGFLSLPYITLKIGILPMLFYFTALTVFVIFIHLIFAEICLKTPDFKRWPGFVGHYLGENAKKVILFPMIMGSFGVMLAYLLIGGSFLTAIFQPMLGGGNFHYILLYFAVLSIILYFGVKAISKIEFWALTLLVVSLGVILAKGFSQIDMANVLLSPAAMPDWKVIFLPYGAIIFSLWGTGLIPETEEMVRGHKGSLKKIIIFGTLIPAVLYVVFIFLILGITGASTTEAALTGLTSFLGRGIISVALFIGVITTFTAFLAQGLLLKKVFMYDMDIPALPAWIFTCLTPLLLFLIGFNSFIPLISFVGAVLLGIDGILILLMYKKIGGKKVVMYPLVIFFVLGIIYSIVYFAS